MKPTCILLLLLVLPATVSAQTMDWEAYDPPSSLVVEENIVTKAKFPFIDVHNHQRRASGMSADDAAFLIAQMDSLNMGVLVNLSGGSGQRLQEGIQNLERRYPDRVVFFANVDFDGISEPGWGERAAAQLELDVKNGARGLKIFKNLGMTAKDAEGARIATDDPRIDPVWAKCGELGIPVLIHTADPSQFWLPHDENNERWFELKERPRRIRRPGEYPPFESIIAEQHNVFRKHPGTNFINAHLGWYGNNLGKLGELMDEFPNMYTEVGAVLAELGRQPHSARKFLTKYKERVLFGKDSWNPPEYHVYFRVFETQDEYFKYYRRRHGFWRMYGMGLSDDVLKHIYYKNAIRIIPGIDASAFPE